jgi:V/A-type H+-transporting ATPase subunit D
MAIKFQYNKIALQNLDKQLKTRLKALPTIKNKEAALRMEVIKAKDEIKRLQQKLNVQIQKYSTEPGIWNEFNSSLVEIEKTVSTTKKIAGVRIHILQDVIFRQQEFSLFDNPKWFPQGISIIKELAKISTEKEFFNRKMVLLDHARKKTTQKVNLYEKVQIPGYEDAIRKIKRFLEDEENLSKSSQKIIKNRQQQQMEVSA